MNHEDHEALPFASITIEGAEPSAGLAVTQELPDTMMVFPLRQTVPFPNLMMPVLLDTDRAHRRVEASVEFPTGNSHRTLELPQFDPLVFPGPDVMMTTVGKGYRLVPGNHAWDRRPGWVGWHGESKT